MKRSASLSSVETCLRAVIRAQRRLIHCYAIGDHVGQAERRVDRANEALEIAEAVRALGWTAKEEAPRG